MCAAQPVGLLLWKVLPQNPLTNWIKLLAFVGVLAFMGYLAYRGLLPRTQVIKPGELAVSD